MAAGCPVLASDIPVFKEIYGQAATYFDPKSAESLIQAIEQLRQLSPKPRLPFGKGTPSGQIERNKLIEQGKKQAKQYSWDEMVEKTIEVFKSQAEASLRERDPFGAISPEGRSSSGRKASQ